MKILVTGGTGFIGKNLSVGYKLSSSDVDLRDFNKTLRCFLDYEPDAIIHCAARHGNFKEMQEDKVSFFRDNQLIDLNVFESARLAGVKKLIALRGQNKDLKIYIKGDKNLNYGKIMDLMSFINKSGFKKVALVTKLK